jgi:17beta-estradiol 17-dehydrogenase / very-long-chain 3-oxoacyl-CoA reductase
LCFSETGSVLSHLNLPCGATTSPYISTPYYSHALAQWAVDTLFTKKFWMNYTHRLHKDINRRAIRKREREAAAKVGGKTE